MDGRKKKLISSLQARLSISVLIAITLVAVIAGAFSYWYSFVEAIELQDEQLIRLAALVDDHHIAPQNPAKPVHISKADPESHFVVQRVGPEQHQANVELKGLPDELPEGLQTLQVNQIGWRVLVKTLDGGERILVAQQTEMRDELARDSAFNTLVPLLVLIPLVLLLLAYIIRQVFAPLKKMAMQLDSASDQDLLQLSELNLASEIKPFVTAINRLLGRVRESIIVQRQFVRDAAHELRSPLTAISLQAERLVESNQDLAQHTRLVNLHKATERTRILIEQLLAMARVQESAPSVSVAASLKTLLREVLEDLLPVVDSKEIDLSVSGEDISVVTQVMDLHILLKNIIENSIHYTPARGRIEIMLSENSEYVELTVKDSGIGIPESEQERVFDAFYRVLGNDQPGSGLGLSIVKTIAARLHVSVGLANNLAPESGLSVKVVFKK